MVSKVGKSDIINLPLTVDEAYTLQLIVGFVGGDSDIYSISNKLVELTGEEPDVCDYKRVKFSVENDIAGTVVNLEEDECVVIRIN